jgi:hypothetical protein
VFPFQATAGPIEYAIAIWIGNNMTKIPADFRLDHAGHRSGSAAPTFNTDGG